MTTRYRAYDLLFCSDLDLPELARLDDSADVDTGSRFEGTVAIRLGTTPEALIDPVGMGVLYQANANQFLLAMAGVARYLVQNGNEIIIEPAPDAPDSDIRVFLLGSCFGALLHQRGMLVLHASAMRTEAGAVLFCGRSGIGKSTLLGELLRRGHPMMVDDVCAVVLDDAGMPWVLPGYPRTRLWADSAQVLELETDALTRTRPTLEKYERQVPELFWGKPSPLHRIYTLTSSNRDELQLDPLPRIQTFRAVLHNTYRQLFLDGLEMRRPHFDLASTVAARVGVTRVVRPFTGFRLTELADLIEDDLRQP